MTSVLDAPEDFKQEESAGLHRGLVQWLHRVRHTRARAHAEKVMRDDDALELEKIEEEEERGDDHLTTAWGTARSLINAAVSGGVLALAYQIPRAGLGMVTLLMFFSAFLLYETLMMLYKATLLLKVSSYVGLARKLWGKRGSQLVALSLTLGQFGILVGYANILRDTLPWVIQFNVEGCVDYEPGCDLPVYLRSWFLIALLMIFFIGPISLRSNPDVFATISFTTFIHFGLFMILVFVGAATYWPSNNLPGVFTEKELDDLMLPKSTRLYPAGTPAFKFQEDAVLTFAILAFAMEAHTTGLEILYGTRITKSDIREGETLKDTKIRITSVIVAGSFAAVFVYYLIIMIGSYIAFGPTVRDNSLNSFPPGDAFAQVIRCTYTFELGTSVPIYVYAMRRDLTAAIYGLKGGQAEMDRIEEENRGRTVFITVSLLFLSTALGVVGTLSLILGLTGAIVTSLNTYVFPALLYNKFMKDSGQDSWERSIAIPLAVFGVLVSIIALYAQINVIIDEGNVIQT